MERASDLARLSVEHLNAYRFATKGPECKGCLVRRELDFETGEFCYMIYHGVLRAHHLFLFRNEKAQSCQDVIDLRLPIREFKPDSSWPHCGECFELGAAASDLPATGAAAWKVGIPLSGGGRWQGHFNAYAKSAVCGLEAPAGEDEYEDGDEAVDCGELDGLLASLPEQRAMTDSLSASDSGSISSSGKRKPPPPPRRCSVLSVGHAAPPSSSPSPPLLDQQLSIKTASPPLPTSTPVKEKPRPPARALPSPPVTANQPPLPPKVPISTEPDKPHLPPKLPAASNQQPPLPPKLPAAANQPPLPPKLPAETNQPPLPPKLPAAANQPPLLPKLPAAANQPPLPPKLPAETNQPPLPPKLPTETNQPPLPPKLPAETNQPPLPPKLPAETNQPPLPPKLIVKSDQQPPLPPKNSAELQPQLPPKSPMPVPVAELEPPQLPPKLPTLQVDFQPTLFGLLHHPSAAPPDALCGYYRKGYYSGDDVKEAKRLMRYATGNGVYMLRGFCQGQQNQELAVCLRLDDKSYKFGVEASSGSCQQFYIAGESGGRAHESVETLLFYHHLFPILTGIDVSDMRLSWPFDLERDAVIKGLTGVFSACLWHYGGKAACTDILVEAADGTYALRMDSYDTTVLCVVHRGQVLKFRIVVTGGKPTGEEMAFAINVPNSVKFPSIEELLMHHHKNPLPTSSQGPHDLMLRIPFQLMAKCQNELSRLLKLPDELVIRHGSADSVAAKLSKSGASKGGGNFYLHLNRERKGGGGTLLAIEESGGEVHRLRVVAVETGLIGHPQKFVHLEDKPNLAALTMDRLVQFLCANPSCLPAGFPPLFMKL